MKQAAKTLLIVLSFAFSLALIPAIASAQLATGTIKGTILDPDGATIPGAKLTVESPAIMGKKEKLSEEGGRFIFQDLPSGIYTLRVNAPGYNAYLRENIQVDIGRSVVLPIFMSKPGGQGEIIEIVEQGAPTIDVTKTSNSEVLSTDFLEELPTSRDYQSTIQALPGVTGGANPNVMGSASNENAILLDGVNITDPVTGTFSMNFNFDAMEQVEASTGAYGAEYGQSMGSITNITTKSGGNELEMKFTVQVQNDVFSPQRPGLFTSDGTQVFTSELDRVLNTNETAASAGGPLIKDKLWFFVSYSHNQSQLTNLGVEVPRDYRGHYFFSKVTYMPTNDHEFVASYFTNPTQIDNVRQSAFALPEAEATQFQGGGLLRADWRWFISPNTRLETRAYTFSNFINVYPVACTEDPTSPYKQCQSWESEGDIDFDTIGVIGVGNAYSQDNFYQYTFDDRRRTNVSARLNHYIPDLLGEHQIGVGAEFMALSWQNTSGFIGNKYQVNILSNPFASPFDPTNVSEYYYVEYDGPRIFSSAARQFNAYMTDSWKPIRNLTINYGLRFDSSAFFNDVGDRIISVNIISPRIGAAWDPFNDQSTVLKFHIGRYVDSGRFAISNFLNSRYGGSKLILGDFFEGSNQNNTLFQADLGQNRYESADNLVSPHTDELTVGLEREIVYDIALGVTGVQKWYSNLWEDDEINLVWNEDATSVVGARYSGQINDIYRLRTPDEAFRTYRSLQFTARQRFSDKKLELLASYTLSELKGNTGTNLTANLDIPQQNQYSIGYLGTDRRHVIKVNATYQLPLDIVLGTTFDYLSGNPFNLLAWNDWYLGYNNYTESRGTHGRNPNYWTNDIRVAKNVDLKEFGRMELSVDILNVFNNRSIGSISTGNYNTYGEILPASVLRPRRFSLQMRLEY